MQLPKHSKTIAFITLGLGPLAIAGETESYLEPLPNEPDHAPTGFCDAFTNIGKLYKNKENPFLQEFSIHGRLNYQVAWFDGNDVNGRNFNDQYEEVRRFRLGAKAKFLNYFDFKFTANLVNDSRPKGDGIDWGYENLDEATVGFDIKKAFGITNLDKLHISYGVQKFDLGGEANESSKNIVTAERSGISNKVYLDGLRPTGFKLRAEKNSWDVMLGLYSTEENPEFDGKWDEGLAYQATVGYQASDDLKYVADFVYNNSDLGEEDQWDYLWASSVRAEYNTDRWGVMTEAIYGDNGDSGNGVTDPNRQGTFWAAIVTPYYWLVEERLQASFQYQYAGSSESEGIRTSSRYLRREHSPGVDVNSGRGDEHHSYYLGLNYHFCGNNSKVMAGIQYDDLSTPNGDVEGTTLWLAFRTYF